MIAAVEALAAAGQHADAIRIADTITDLRLRAIALIKLALASDEVRASQLCARAWTLSDWSVPLPVLGRICNPALLVLADLEKMASFR